MTENWVRPSGGVANGFWPKSDKEWWCSSGIFGSLAIHLYAETGDRSLLQIGLGTIDWLNQQDLLGQTDYPLPTVLMYSLEAYSAGLPYLEPGTARRQATMAQLAKFNEWLAANFGRRAGMDNAYPVGTPTYHSCGRAYPGWTHPATVVQHGAGEIGCCVGCFATDAQS